MSRRPNAGARRRGWPHGAFRIGSWEPVMIFSPGDHVLVAHRRLFAEDQARFFVGRVEEWQAGMIAATGYA